MRRAIEVGAPIWAAVALSFGLATLGSYNSDARPFVVGATIVAAAAAALASVKLAQHRDRIAGVLLIVSAVAPTSFAWVLNVPALFVGAVLCFTRWLLLVRARGAST